MRRACVMVGIVCFDGYTLRGVDRCWLHLGGLGVLCL